MQALQKYQQALALYKLHRQAFQENVSRQTAIPPSTLGTGSALRDALGGAQVQASDYKMPRIKVPADSSFASVTAADAALTDSEQSLGGAIPALLASRSKISDREFAAAWQELFKQALAGEQEVVALNAKLAAQHAENNTLLTNMIHQAERDGIQSELRSTYATFKQSTEIENELFRRADLHSKIALQLKSDLLQCKPPGVGDELAAGLMPLPLAEPVIGPTDAFLSQDIASQQIQLDREYALVTRLFARLDRLSKSLPRN